MSRGPWKTPPSGWTHHLCWGRVTDCISQSVNNSVCQLDGRDWESDWLTDWLTDWARLTDWLIDCLNWFNDQKIKDQKPRETRKNSSTQRFVVKTTKNLRKTRKKTPEKKTQSYVVTTMEKPRENQKKPKKKIWRTWGCHWLYLSMSQWFSLSAFFFLTQSANQLTSPWASEFRFFRFFLVSPRFFYREGRPPPTPPPIWDLRFWDLLGDFFKQSQNSCDLIFEILTFARGLFQTTWKQLRFEIWDFEICWGTFSDNLKTTVGVVLRLLGKVP